MVMTTHPRQEFRKALLAVDRVTAEQILMEGKGETNSVATIDSVVVPVLAGIGEEWERGEISLAQVYMAGRICEDLVDRVLTVPEEEKRKHPPIALGVLLDHHLLGKRIVYSVLRASGFDVLDYGGGLEPSEVVERVQADEVAVLLISSLMFPSALKVKEISEGIRTLPNPPALVVGGAPFLFDTQLWQQVGADAMGRSAADAVSIVTRLLEVRHGS